MPPDNTTIQLHIHEVRQLFNTIDPSPFRERDLDPECEEFIVAWARELPPDRPVRIEILKQAAAGDYVKTLDDVRVVVLSGEGASPYDYL